MMEITTNSNPKRPEAIASDLNMEPIKSDIEITTTNVNNKNNSSTADKKQQQAVKLDPPIKAINVLQLGEIVEMLDDLDEELKKKNKGPTAVINQNIDDDGITGNITALFVALLVIFQLARESRTLAGQQRRLAHTLNVNALRGQASELKKSADAQIGTAFISAAVAAVSIGAAGFNVKNSLGTLKDTKTITAEMKVLETDITAAREKLDLPENQITNGMSPQQQQDITAKRQLLETEIKEKSTEINDKQRQLEEAISRSRTNETMAYAMSSGSQALSSAVGAMGQAIQATFQAAVKALEADAAEVNLYTEVAREAIGSEDALLSDVVRNFSQMSENFIAALRQSTNLA